MNIFEIIFIFCCISFNKAHNVELNSSEWSQVLQGNCYTPWCSACKNFKPTWLKLSNELSSNNDVKFASIDITKSPQFSVVLTIKHIPTIYFLKDGDIYEYIGDRSISNIKDYYLNKKYSDSKPVSGFFTPNSFGFGVIMPFLDAIFFVTSSYERLIEQGWSKSYAAVIFASCLIVGSITVALFIVFICDCFCPPRPQALRYIRNENVKPPQPLVTKDNDNESDSIISASDEKPDSHNTDINLVRRKKDAKDK